MSELYGQGNNTMKWALPDPADPTDYVCYLIRVPKSNGHIEAFKGSIYDLSLWWNWERDAAHTARIAAYAWRRVFENLTVIPCEPVLQQGGGCGCEDENMAGCGCLEFVNGVLGCKDCFGNFVPIPGQGNTGSSTNTPPQPAPGGGQQAYNNCFSAKEQQPLPTTVSTGDTISVESYSGAWNDPGNDGLVWRGPNGQVYFAGVYLPGTEELVGTDPLPTAPHMSVVALIAGTYYPLIGGTLTIPPGVSNAQVLLQANDSVLSDDQGSVCITLNVTNNQAAEWSHTFDLTFNAYPAFFHPETLAGYTPGHAGHHVSGEGYRTDFNTLNSSPNNGARIVDVECTIPFHLKRLRVNFTYAEGSFANPTSPTGSISVNGTLYDQTILPTLPTSPLDTGPVDIDATDIVVYLGTGDTSTGADPGGEATIFQVTIDGSGPDPF